jgi:hypothetical protein
LTEAEATKVSPTHWDADNGLLIVDWYELLGYPCRLLLRDWESGLTAYTQTRDTVEAVRLDAVGDWVLDLVDPAVLQWRSSIPRGVLSSVKLLPTKRANCLDIAARSLAARQLLESNPLMFWMLVDQGHIDEANDQQLEKLLGQKQKHILASLGLRGTAQQVRLLGRFGELGLSKKDMPTMLRVLSNQAACDYLGHQAHLAIDTLRVLDRYPWLPSCPARALIPELLDQQTRRWLDDSIQMLEDIEPVRQCVSSVSLNRLHARLINQVNRDRDNRFFRRNDSGALIPLPVPPIPASDKIFPLVCQKQIVSEGREMQHCIAGYIDRVIAGSYYVYRMIQPERVTIGVTIGGSGVPFIDDIRGKCNASPSSRVETMVRSWLLSHLNQSRG